MNENDEFTHVQRRLSEVMAKSEWTSSRMRMQKSGEELRERRAKSHQTANQFLQGLFEKRSDSDLIDDHGVVDRYNKFVKHKSALHDDTNSTLDEFERRLRTLNNQRRNQTTKLNNQNLNTSSEKQQQQLISDLQSIIEDPNDKKDLTTKVLNNERPKHARVLPSISAIPVTSTPNDTADELTTSVFHDDENQELSHVQAVNISFIDSQANHIESPIPQDQSKTREKSDTLNSSTLSLNHSLTQTLFAPKARRSDGTEIAHSRSPSPLLHTSATVLSIHPSCFPRSLTSRGKLNSTPFSKRQLPSLPNLQSLEHNDSSHEQFDTHQLYDLLDHLDSTASDRDTDFTRKLDQLTLSTILPQHTGEITSNLSTENVSSIQRDDDEDPILPNFFDPTFSSAHGKRFYTTITIDLNDSKALRLYTMTFSTVQLSASILLPYSILNGRRPFLTGSNQTDFKSVRSKQKTSTCQVTAIESVLDTTQLQQNDILLKIDEQSVWGLTKDEILEILKQSNHCSLTVARLSQPFI